MPVTRTIADNWNAIVEDFNRRFSELQPDPRSNCGCTSCNSDLAYISPCLAEDDGDEKHPEIGVVG